MQMFIDKDFACKCVINTLRLIVYLTGSAMNSEITLS